MSVDRTDPGPKVDAHQHTGRGATRVPYPIGIRTAQVARREMVTPRMLRLTLSGDELDGLHTYVFDDHVKVVFPFPDGTRNDPVPNDRQMLTWERPHPPTRAYTIRRYDAAAREVDLDFVVHAEGLANDWSLGAGIGDSAVIAGPPGGKALAQTHRHYLLAVDTTGLPAVARWLDEADWLEEAGATAHLLIDHDHAEETSYPLRERPGVEVRWLSRADGSQLAEVATGLDLPADTALFAAGEAGDIKPLRRWAADRGYASSFTGYWKRGVEGLEE